MWAYLSRKLNTSDTEIEYLKTIANKSENATVKEEIKIANAQIQDFNNLSLKTPKWSVVLEAFVRNVPEGVKITQFDANSTKKEITISGYGPTRDLVIELYNNINSDKEHFKNINYPLENVTQPSDVRFYFTFAIADGVLVEGETTPDPAVEQAAVPAVEETK